MQPTPEEIRSVLKNVKYPGFTRDIVSFGIVKDVKVDGGKVEVYLMLPKEDPKLESQIGESVRSAVLESP